MCIRDRFLIQPIWSRRASLCAVPSALTVLPATAAKALDAVSYTHLDVYKIQVHAAAFFQDKLHDIPDVFPRKHNEHLDDRFPDFLNFLRFREQDVYKRQERSFFMRAILAD